MDATQSLTPVPPVRPAAGYIGGKRNLSVRLIERIRSSPHRTYAEPFVGMGGVFLRRPFRAPAEVINDISADVAGLFRMLQRHYVPFMDMLRYQLTTRVGFERLIATDPETLTDLERAARFLYLQRIAFGSKVRGRNFGVAVAQPSAFDVTKLAPMLEAIHERLAGVVIERLDWRRFIERYDRPETLFYLDPPYWGCERDYGDGVFVRDDFEAMADVLGGIRGRFILSINDRPETRVIFARFTLDAVPVTYTVGGGANAQKASELIVSN
jgi:DNA adenine methylase